LSAPASSSDRYADFDVERDYARLRGPVLGLLRRDGWTISDDEWDAAWNAVCTNVWRRQQEVALDFRGEPLNYLLATAKNELRRERRRARLDLVSLDADGAPEPVAPRADLDEELDLRDKLRIAQTIARSRLRPRELHVWGLRVVCGLSYEEGAARLGIAPKRFEKELMSAHAKIADEIRAVAAGTWCESTKGVSLLRAYEEGVLDPGGSALRELREHAQACPACRRAMKAVEGIVPLLLPPAPVLFAATAPPDGGSIEQAAHAAVPLPEIPARAWDSLAAPRRAAAELWRAISGSEAVQSGGHGGPVPRPGSLASGVFERAVDGTLRAAEVAPSDGANAGEVISAGAGGGVAVGGSVAAKLLAAGTAAVCAMGGQQLCARLFATQPPGEPHETIGHGHGKHVATAHPARLAPPVRIPQPATRPAATARQLAQPGARSIESAERQRAGSAPPRSAAPVGPQTASSSSTPTSPDRTFDQAAPSRPSSSPPSQSSGGAASGSRESSGGDATFDNLP
jgi:DNA-directed RNA polymerase specialized sigma24 family protein